MTFEANGKEVPQDFTTSDTYATIGFLKCTSTVGCQGLQEGICEPNFENDIASDNLNTVTPRFLLTSFQV